MNFTRMFGKSLLIPLIVWRVDAECRVAQSLTAEDMERPLDARSIADYLCSLGLQN